MNENLNKEAQDLINKISDSFDGYLEENMYIGILTFMMLCTESAKFIERQRLKILELETIRDLKE